MNAVQATPQILVIDDDAEMRYSLHRVLGAHGHEAAVAANGAEGVELAAKISPRVVFLDNRMEGMSGLETLQHLRARCPSAMVILMTAFGTTQTTIEAMKYGAFDYLPKPFDVQKVLSLAESALKAFDEQSKAQKAPAAQQPAGDAQEGIIGSSPAMQEVFKIIGQVAASEATVIITGESGTGKELVARSLHQHSLRAAGPFVPVNCAAIPETLIESELFGHEKGSFTGATQQRLGKFELGDCGTVFLDEIGDMALSTQTKILRAIQEGEIQRVGGGEPIKVNVRLIAATNKELEKLVAEKTFREDLYYRLNVVRIKLPPLRDRLEDVPQLVEFLLRRLGKKKQSRGKRISPEALAALAGYNWPGNVRELENVIHRSAVVAQGATILPKDLPPEITRLAPKAPPAAQVAHEISAVAAMPAEDKKPAGGAVDGISFDEACDLLYQNLRKTAGKALLQTAEREIISRALKETGGNQVKAAALLGITRATLRKRIEEYSIKY